MSYAKSIVFSSFAMCVAVTASNILVQYPVYWFDLGNILTYGAFTYPFAFLVNDLTNRRFGSRAARRVVYIGFCFGLIVSWELATPRLAIASGTAFLFGQLLDIIVFSPLRKQTWWKAPLLAGICGALIDTFIFFAIAFSPRFAFIDALTGMQDSSLSAVTQLFSLTIPVWFSLSLGDLSVKLVMAVLMLIPYGAILAIFMPAIYSPKDMV